MSRIVGKIRTKSGKRLVKVKLTSIQAQQNKDLSDAEKREISETETACRHVMSHPMYSVILDSIREGTKLSEIAKYLAVEGYLSVTEPTMLRYLSLFRKRYRAEIYSGDKKTFDSEFPADVPSIDVETELMRLIRMQKRRIHSEYAIEQTMGKALNTTVKEVEQGRELLKLLAIVRGDIKPTGAPTGAASPDSASDPEARKALTDLRKDEMERDRMSSLVAQLLGGDD